MKVENQELVWNEIAVKWNKFREVPSPTVVKFLENKHGKILDLGCGSGRNFSAIAHASTSSAGATSDDENEQKLYGIDFSDKMLVHAKEKAKGLELKADFLRSNSDKLPFKDDFFDSIICVAVLHCVPLKEERIDTIKEIYRTLKKGSSALISVWGKGSPRLKNKSKECFVSWTVKNDKDFRKEEGEIKQQRYTYIYDLEELKKEILDAGFEIESIWEERNVNVIVKK